MQFIGQNDSTIMWLCLPSPYSPGVIFVFSFTAVPLCQICTSLPHFSLVSDLYVPYLFSAAKSILRLTNVRSVFLTFPPAQFVVPFLAARSVLPFPALSWCQICTSGPHSFPTARSVLPFLALSWYEICTSIFCSLLSARSLLSLPALPCSQICTTLPALPSWKICTHCQICSTLLCCLLLPDLYIHFPALPSFPALPILTFSAVRFVLFFPVLPNCQIACKDPVQAAHFWKRLWNWIGRCWSTGK